MTPNLRYNKSLTRKLIKAIPKEKNNITLSNIEWNMENQNNVYGLKYHGLFRSTIFFLQRVNEAEYRLVIPEGSYPVCNFYIIDNIEAFLDIIGVEILELDNSKEIHQALQDTAMLPNTGIILIDEDKIYIYDHKNY